MSEYDKAAMCQAIRDVLIAVARAGDTITYEDLCRRVDSGHLNPAGRGHRTRLPSLLNAICERELHMLSAVVIREGRELPGDGFSKLAKRPDRLDSDDPDDRKAFWNAEGDRVHAHDWS